MAEVREWTRAPALGWGEASSCAAMDGTGGVSGGGKGGRGVKTVLILSAMFPAAWCYFFVRVQIGLCAFSWVVGASAATSAIAVRAARPG